MAPKMAKATQRAMSKGDIAKALANDEVSEVQASALLDRLAFLAQTEVKRTGSFTIPGFAKVKSRTKPATKAGDKRKLFGKDVVMEKDKPAQKIVKAYVNKDLLLLEGATFVNAVDVGNDTFFPWEGHPPISRRSACTVHWHTS